MVSLELDYRQLTIDNDAYPDPAPLADQTDWLTDRSWDCVAILDACRWDAMQILLDTIGEHHRLEMARTPTDASTPGWMSHVLHRDTHDWSELTYVMANTIFKQTADAESFDYYHPADHVGTFIDATGSKEEPTGTHDNFFGGKRPDLLTEIAAEQEPPLLVHYLQPHTPHVGSIKTAMLTHNHFLIEREWNDEAANVGIVSEGHVSPALWRAAYLQNLALVWRFASKLVRTFDRVVFTADHGEALGETVNGTQQWDHGGPATRANQVVPWVEFGPDDGVPHP